MAQTEFLGGDNPHCFGLGHPLIGYHEGMLLASGIFISGGLITLILIIVVVVLILR
jgi:hypothetical protein